MEANVALPSDDADLNTAFTYQQYLDVAINDEARVEQCTTGGYTIQLFKQQNANNTDYINVSWEGQSGRTPSASPVYLQVYNQITTTWVAVDSDNTTGDDTDFPLSGSVTTDVGNYYAAGNWVSFRVWQEGI